MMIHSTTMYGNTIPTTSIALCQEFIMNTTDYWPFAREYSILNVAAGTLQFWTAYLELHNLSSAID